MELLDTVSATFCYFAMHSASYTVEEPAEPNTESTELGALNIEWVAAVNAGSGNQA